LTDVSFFLQHGIRASPGHFVMFEPTSTKITLDIPLEGIVLRNGWSITPLTIPVVCKAIS